MSVNLLESAGLVVTRYVGPVGAEHLPRARFQITNTITAEYVTMSYPQLFQLITWLANTNAAEMLHSE